MLGLAKRGLGLEQNVKIIYCIPMISAEIEAERGGTAFRQFISRRNAVPPLLMKHRSGLRRNAFRHLVVPTLYHTKNCRGHFTQKKNSLALLAIFVPLYIIGPPQKYFTHSYAIDQHGMHHHHQCSAQGQAHIM